MATKIGHNNYMRREKEEKTKRLEQNEKLNFVFGLIVNSCLPLKLDSFLKNRKVENVNPKKKKLRVETQKPIKVIGQIL